MAKLIKFPYYLFYVMCKQKYLIIIKGIFFKSQN